jgi:hypothetical protein
MKQGHCSSYVTSAVQCEDDCLLGRCVVCSLVDIHQRSEVLTASIIRTIATNIVFYMMTKVKLCLSSIIVMPSKRVEEWRYNPTYSSRYFVTFCEIVTVYQFCRKGDRRRRAAMLAEYRSAELQRTLTGQVVCPSSCWPPPLDTSALDLQKPRGLNGTHQPKQRLCAGQQLLLHSFQCFSFVIPVKCSDSVLKWTPTTYFTLCHSQPCIRRTVTYEVE